MSGWGSLPEIFKVMLTAHLHNANAKRILLSLSPPVPCTRYKLKQLHMKAGLQVRRIDVYGASPFQSEEDAWQSVEI